MITMALLEGHGFTDLERGPEEVCLATFWRQATPGTSYWRCEIPARHLPGQMIGMKEEDLVAGSDDVGREFLLPRQRGTAIWQFLGDDARSRIAFYERDFGTRTLMELDDNYLRPSPFSTGAWKRTAQEAGPYGYSHEAHRILVPQLDGVIVSTEHLANAYADFNDNVYHCPNSVDPADWTDIPRHESENLRIGYYASGSHVRDWPYVKKALKWAERQRGVEIVLIGYAPPGFRGRNIPWQDDLTAARRALGELDVGLCPLQPNDWANGKSDVKAMEYAMAGALPIVSHTEPYRPWWGNGWGWVAQSNQDWREMIQHVVKHRDEVKDAAWKAKQYVLRERTIQDSIHLWKEAVLGG